MAQLEKIKKSFERHSKYEKTLIMFLLFFAILALILFFIVVCRGTSKSNICTTPSCISAANSILSTVDSSLDPCDDFYQFACGNLFKNSFRRSQPTILHELKELKKHQVQQLVFMEVPDEDKLPRSYRYLRKFYQLCYNTTAIEEDKDQTFLEGLDRVIGGWPLANGYSMPFDWPEVMLKARHEGMTSNFFLNIGFFKPDNESEYYLQISPSIKYGEEVWDEDKVGHYVEIAALWGRTVPGARAEMLKTMEFAKKLNHISEKSLNATANVTLEHKKLTIGELQKTLQYVPIVNWLEFLKNYTKIRDITQNTIVLVGVTQEYFKDLQLLMLHTESKWRANYVAAVVLLDEFEYLSQKVREIVEKIRIPSKPKSRMELCAENAIDHFRRVIEGVYIRKIVTPEKKSDILSILKRVKNRLELAVNRTTWIDQESKNSLTKSLTNLSIAIGWTDIIFDEEKYEKIIGFDKLHLDFDKSIISVYHDINQFRYEIKYRKKEDKSYRLFLEMAALLLDVNGYYMKINNLLILTAPLLQYPIYDIERPKYMNYGSLGGLIGHELTHAVTHTYAQDKQIESHSSDRYDQIWTNRTKDNFENVSQCVIDEYNNYDFNNSVFGDLAGNETLEENLADFTGINLAYEAYQSWVYEHGQEQLLPGVSFTPNQIYWLMSTTFVCLDEKLLSEKSCKNRIHGESSFRTNGPIRNSPYFARDFGCPVGSKMNPKEKCRVYL